MDIKMPILTAIYQMRNFIPGTFVFAFIFVESLTAVYADLSKIVDLGYARYKGRDPGAGITEWLGIRYAAAPVGNLRFEAPQDPPFQNGVQNAFQHGKTCLATSDIKAADSSEDCLFLDVYAPSRAKKGSNLPVFVFIQGGGFQSNANPNLNGTGLITASNDGIIVVTFNYRVGIYGFLGGPVIAAEASVNNGLKDQIKVFEWVKTHIFEFGGNPNHVVIGGDSAGAQSIALHLTANRKRMRDLFVAAAAESQSFPSLLTVDQSDFIYENIVIRTGCMNAENQLACLRELNASFIQAHDMMTPFPGAQAPPLYMYGPLIDGDIIPDYTVRLYEQGRFLRVPVIFGDDTNEGTIFTPKQTDSYSDASIFMRNNFPELSGEIAGKLNQLYVQNSSQIYPGAGNFWRQVSDQYGEVRYICPGIHISDMIALYGGAVWNYHYDVLDPSSQANGFGVSHTIEVNSIWGPENIWHGNPPASYSTSNAPIVPIMQGYWTSFIMYLDPSKARHEDSPQWKRWNEQGQQQRLYIRTDDIHMEQVPSDQKNRCSYWRSIALMLRQ